MLRASAPAPRLDPVRQERDEDEIVDPEHDLHRDQGRQRRPGGGIGGEPRQRVHASPVQIRPGFFLAPGAIVIGPGDGVASLL